MNKKDYVYNIYNFLNNTKGYIECYEVIYLLKFLNKNIEKVNNNVIYMLSSLIESGEKEDEFYNLLLSL